MSVTKYTKSRYSFYIFLSILIFAVPFVQIDGISLFLLSFTHGQLHLFFTKFDMQELYLMPFLFIILFLSIFFITTLGGRIWCGWSCPQTIFRVIYRDIIQTKMFKIYKSIKNKQKEPQKNIYKKISAIIVFVPIALVASANLLWFFIQPYEFLSYIKNPAEHPVVIGFWLVIAGWIIFDITFLAEKFCVYLCPYARVQSVMFDNDTVQVIYNEKRGGIVYEENTKLFSKPRDGECIGCEACVKVCPTHIDIRKGMQLECINCLECVDACTKTMSAFNTTSLIEWSSINSITNKEPIKFARFRTIGYAAVLCIAFIALILMTGKKEQMLLNINRTSELFSRTNNNAIQNSYLFLFQNTDEETHEYYFDVKNENITIIKPAKPFKLKAGEKKRVIVILQSNSCKKEEEKLIIHAYAKDDPDRINVERSTIFIYPARGK